MGIFIFVLLSIPVGAYLVSDSQTIKSQASEQKNTKPIISVTPKPTEGPARMLLNLSQKASDSTLPSSTPIPSSPTVVTSFGPTLSLKVDIEGRPDSNQTARLFVGILEGTLTSNPKFLLSFTVDVSASGGYEGLSLAGLDAGSAYTALIKGPAQIANSSSFTMSPAVTNLNSGEPVALTSGDLNEDNVINSADYSIAQKAAGAASKSSNWNENADVNKDGVINVFDLSIITKNMGKIGASGAWTSPVPKTATPSASLSSPPVGSPQGGSGHWVWIPK